MTVEQLKTLWNKGSKVSNYKDIDPSFPDQKVALFGPGTDSGTFDFFTAEINGEEGDTRKDYSPSEDDNVTVQGVSGDKGGLGYFGFSYYEDNADNLNLVKVDAGDGCVEPSAATIQDGSLQAARSPAVHVPGGEVAGAPGGQGLHGLHPREPAGGRRRVEDRRADRRAGHRSEGRAHQGRELSART